MVDGEGTLRVTLDVSSAISDDPLETGTVPSFNLTTIEMFGGAEDCNLGDNSAVREVSDAGLRSCTQVTANYRVPGNLSNLEAPGITIANDSSFFDDDLNTLSFGSESERRAFFNNFVGTSVEVVKFGVNFLPFFSDGADLLGQLYNRATGQQIDPVIAVLASAGLILDTTTGGFADVTAIFKGGYKLSLDLANQGVGGVLAETFSDQVLNLTSGDITPGAFVNTLKDRFDAVVRLGTTPGCGFFGSSCIPRYDRIARSIADTNSVDASTALTNLDEIYLKDAKLDVAETNYKDRIDDLDASSTCFLRSLGSTSFSIEVLANPCPLTFDREPSGIPGLPRVTRVRADLDNSFIGTSPTKAARNFIRQYGKPGDDAGHIVARVLGGQGGVSSDNIVPVASSINRGPMATLEGELKRALQDQRSVSVDIRLEYDDPAMPLRPTRIIYNYTIDGDPDTRTFTQ